MVLEQHAYLDEDHMLIILTNIAVRLDTGNYLAIQTTAQYINNATQHQINSRLKQALSS